MLGEAWRVLARRFIVYDVPDEMAACFGCDVTRCPDDKYAACVTRLAHVAAQRVPENRTMTQSERVTASR